MVSADATQLLGNETGSAEVNTCSIFRKLAKKEHSAELAQLNAAISTVMEFGTHAGKDFSTGFRKTAVSNFLGEPTTSHTVMRKRPKSPRRRRISNGRRQGRRRQGHRRLGRRRQRRFSSMRLVQPMSRIFIVPGALCRTRSARLAHLRYHEVWCRRH